MPGMFNKLISFLIINFSVVPILFAQGASQPSTILPNGLTEQKVQDPIVLNPKTINSLFALNAMQTSAIPQFGPQSQLGAKRFWFTRFTSCSFWKNNR